MSNKSTIDMDDYERLNYWWRRAKDAEARIEKVRKFVAPDVPYEPPEDEWELGNKNALDAIHAFLTEGDEQ